MNTDISTTDLEAAMQRGQAEGRDILARLLDGKATHQELVTAVIKRNGSVLGVMETTGLLLAISHFLETTPRLLQLAMQQGQEAADKQWSARVSGLAEPLQGWVIEMVTALAALAEKAGVPCPPIPSMPPPTLPAPPPAPRKVAFTYDASGEIVGATIH